MKNELTCDMIRDLMPSYVDGLTSDASNEAIKAHLADCKDCEEALSAMRSPVAVEKTDIPEVNYLKKIRRSRQRLVIFAAALAVVLLTTLAQIFPTFFVSKAPIEELQWTVLGTGVDINGEDYVEVCIDHLGFPGSKNDIDYVTWETDENNDMHLEVYMRGTPLFSKAQNDSIKVQLTGETVPNRILMNDEYVLWENGTAVEKATSELFALSKDPKAEDYAEQLTVCLGVDKLSEEWLQTPNKDEWTSTPAETAVNGSVWEITLPGEPAGYFKKADIKKTMERISCVLFALTPELETVNWKYAENGAARTFSATRADAAKLAGADVSAFGKDVVSLQRLLDQIDFDRLLRSDY